MRAKVIGLKHRDGHLEALIRYLKAQRLKFDTFNDQTNALDVSIIVYEVDAKAIKQLRGYAERHGLECELYDGANPLKIPDRYR